MHAIRACLFCLGGLSSAHCLPGQLSLINGTEYDFNFSTQETDLIKFSAVPPGAVRSARVGFYKIDLLGVPSDQIVTFCIELTESIGRSGSLTYFEKEAVLNNSKTGLSLNQAVALDRLLGEFYIGETVDEWVAVYGSLRAAGNQATALQLAVWEITHEGEGNGWSLREGDFVAARNPDREYGLADYKTELIPIEELLNGLNEELLADTLQSHLLQGLAGFFDCSPGIQDQVFYVIPEPSVLGIQAVALGLGLTLLRRRRRK